MTEEDLYDGIDEMWYLMMMKDYNDCFEPHDQEDFKNEFKGKTKEECKKYMDPNCDNLIFAITCPLIMKNNHLYWDRDHTEMLTTLLRKIIYCHELFDTRIDDELLICVFITASNFFILEITEYLHMKQYHNKDLSMLIRNAYSHSFMFNSDINKNILNSLELAARDENLLNKGFIGVEDYTLEEMFRYNIPMLNDTIEEDISLVISILTILLKHGWNINATFSRSKLCDLALKNYPNSDDTEIKLIHLIKYTYPNIFSQIRCILLNPSFQKITN